PGAPAASARWRASGRHLLPRGRRGGRWGHRRNAPPEYRPTRQDLHLAGRVCQNLSHRKAKDLKESPEFKLDLASVSVTKLVKKISLSIHYWEQQEEEIEQVLLTGGSAKLKGLKKMIAKKLNVEVDILTGYEQFQFSKGEFSFHSLKEKLPFLIPSLAALLHESKIS
ncbi:MAG: pilus assembly protein PilM, partial [Halanaerobacter sp.]